MNVENLRLVNINTTAFEEEDFKLVTDLTDEQITEVLTPLVEAERNAELEDENDEFEYQYDNDALVGALKEKYPTSVIIYYQDGGEEIKI
jgi:hypothetical protein